MKGFLTAIQRFSLHDGPGIRSTVFFKGCNMHCLWCHNPETISMKPEILYYRTKCVGCGACVSVCSLHSIGEDGKMIFDRSSCSSCGKCAEVCFSGALEKCGFEATAQDVMDEVLQDKDYYVQSGGGITLSGGEVLLQSEFALEVLKEAKNNGIDTALETNLNVSCEVIAPLLTYLDLIMCDLKIMDSEKHRKWTGADNSRILDNIKKLSFTGIPMIVRTPVIPGVNDDEKEISDIAGYLGSLDNILYYELLNFNPLGGSKYEALSMHDEFRNSKPLPEERLEQLRSAALGHISSVRVG